jgi:hypothetical protein
MSEQAPAPISNQKFKIQNPFLVRDTARQDLEEQARLFTPFTRLREVRAKGMAWDCP